jgi:hypothetical protein
MTEVPKLLPENLPSKTKAQLIELCEQMAQDWLTLNAIHNARAAHAEWCSEYEERQYHYNKAFKVLQLFPRSAGLPLTVLGLYDSRGNPLRPGQYVGAAQARL